MLKLRQNVILDVKTENLYEELMFGSRIWEYELMGFL